MTAGRPHKKKPVVKNCRRCGKLFNSPDAQELCPKCRNTLSKCAGCGGVMAREYGYEDDFARAVGKYKICDLCNVGLNNRGFLHISEIHYLLSNGQVKVIRPPANAEKILSKIVRQFEGTEPLGRRG